MMSNEVEGILKRNTKQVFTLRQMGRSLRSGPREILVPGHLVQKFNLVQGVSLSGTLENKAGKSRLVRIDRLCGLAPSVFMGRTPYARASVLCRCRLSSRCSSRRRSFLAGLLSST